MNFPDLQQGTWRSTRPYIVTLVDGDRIPAYPVLGLIKDDRFHYGQACKDRMWMVNDYLISNPLIRELGQTRILAKESVSSWEEISQIQPANTGR